MTEIERQAPGLFLAGHYRDGISLSDSIVSGCNVAERVEKHVLTQMRKAVLLVNLGSPDAPSVAAVRRYLREFLMDGRVLDVNWLARFCIVHFAILPWRPKHSARGLSQDLDGGRLAARRDQPERAGRAAAARGCAG